MRLKGKVALITGGTSGIGRRMVERFVEEGASVFFSGPRAELGAEVAQATRATFIKADAAVEADAARTIAIATADSGRIEVLVNNAGGATGSARLETVSLEDFDYTFAVHVRGAMAHMKHVAALMRAQQQGSIINIGSIAGHRAGYAGTLVLSCQSRPDSPEPLRGAGTGRRQRPRQFHFSWRHCHWHFRQGLWSEGCRG